MLRQMRAVGVNAVLMGGDGIASDEFAALGGPAVEGTLMTFGRDPRRRPEARAVMEKLRARNVELRGYVFHSYAAVEIIRQAMEAAKSPEPGKVAEAMHSGRTFPTVLGPISYDKKGDITQRDYVIYVWKKDATGKMNFVELDQ
jgi:branched-chain amino acid transport system substrate-binding protein